MKKILIFLVGIVVLFGSIGCGKSSENIKSKYEISVILNEDMTADCTLELKYVNSSEKEVKELVFFLSANAFSEGAINKPIYKEYIAEAYPSGINYGGIEIGEVLLSGKNCDFSYLDGDKTLLLISLDSPLKSGQSKEIFISFDLIIPNVKHRFGYGENTINLTGFYPILCVMENGEYYKNKYYPSGDPFYSEVADYYVNLTLPSIYSVASSMAVTSTHCMGSLTKYTYERQSVRDIAFIVSDEFNILRENKNGVSVSYYYFDDTSPEKSLKTAVNSLDWFSNNFCKYPYKEYVVCESDFLYGGMEYPCLSMIDSTLNGFDKDYCIAHETAHQWWYGIVGNNQCEEGYIDEGLTEYSTVLFISNYPEYSQTKNELIERVKNSYLDVRKALLNKGVKDSPIMKKNLGEFTSDLEYVSICYYRSQLMFNELNEYMGDKKFFKFLKSIIKNYKYRNITTQDLLTLAEKTKRGSEELLKNYVNGVSVVK